MHRATPAPSLDAPRRDHSVVLLPGSVIHPRYAGVPLDDVRDAMRARVDELNMEQLAALTWALEALVSCGGSGAR